MRLDDMRLFAKVAELRSITKTALSLGIPKQTVSHRVSALEAALGVKLLHRSPRALALTDVGASYAERCAEVVRLADEANQAVTDTEQVPRGLLRVTADPVFGEAFVAGLVLEFAKRWPEVRVDLLLTRRHVDLIEEGVDVAFRIGRVEDGRLTATSLGPARVRYCASPGYLRKRGAPASPDDLARHDAIVLASDETPVKWPFRGDPALRLVPVTGRVRTTTFAVAHAAARAGLGVAIFPEFACADDLRAKRLVSVLDAFTVPVGDVWMAHPTRRSLSTRVRTFTAFAKARLAATTPWVVPAGRPPAPRKPV